MAKQNDRIELKVASPRGVSIYPKLNEPDTKFDADGVYETKLKFDPAATDGVIGKADATWAALVAKVAENQELFLLQKKKELSAGDGKAKNKAKSITSIEWGQEAHVDDDGEETGLVVIKAKMKASGVSKTDKKPWTRAPKIFDAKGKKLDPIPSIWGGTEMKVAGVIYPYYNAKDNVVGSTFRLEAVQILDLVSGSGRSSGDYGFGQEDGYEADESDDDAPPFAAEPAGSPVDF